MPHSLIQFLIIWIAPRQEIKDQITLNNWAGRELGDAMEAT